MCSTHAADKDRAHNDDSEGALKRIRRRGKLGAVVGMIGYLTTFITDIARADTNDDSIITGLEIGFVVIAVAGALMAGIQWLLTQHAALLRSEWVLAGRAQAQIDSYAASLQPDSRKGIPGQQRI